MAFIEWLALVVAIVSVGVYAVFVWIQTRTMKRQNLVLQESEWIPEILFDASEDLIGTRGKRPWFPEFRIEVDGKKNEQGWVESTFYPVAQDMNIHGVEWKAELHPHIKSFLRDFEEGTHIGKLYFKFETFTGEEYRLIYDIKFRSSEHGYEIVEYPDMKRELPWERRNWLGRLKRKLSPN